jgi:REP element-mobilizing transposase RayT
MARGLNRQAIFVDDADRLDFIQRVERALALSPNEVFAWALMPNHLHFLIRSGLHGLSGFMRRVMTGYALAFNQRHKRVGYLFQGRFKSLVCDEEEYFLTLLRYIHLNPVSGGILRSVEALKTYPFTGHSALMGKIQRPWQSCDDALGRFGRQAGLARRRYETFLSDGVPELRKQPTDLLGAGLIERLRETGQAARRESDRAYQDPRVLGEDEFVEKVLQKADQEDEMRQAFKRRKIDVRGLASHIAKAYGVSDKQLFERGRTDSVSAAKAGLIYAGVHFLGKTSLEMGRLTRMSGQAASRARLRGAEIQAKIDLSKLIS